MKLEFDSNGLPKPGPALDAYLAGHVLGWSDGPHTLYKWYDRKQRKHPVLVFHNRPKGDRSGRWDNSAFVNEAGEKFYISKPKEVYIPDKYSTTHRYFHMMEAMGKSDADYVWTTEDDGECITVVLLDRYGQEWDHYCSLQNYPDRIHATAHAVCACAWKAMGGEG